MFGDRFREKWGVDESEGSLSLAELRQQKKPKPVPRSRMGKYKDYYSYYRLLTPLALGNPEAQNMRLKKKMDCKLFSLEENSDIEPISEEDDDSDEDKPICEVQSFDIVPRVFDMNHSITDYPCIEDGQNEKDDDWTLPPRTKKYVREVVLEEWSDYQSENPDSLAGVNKKQKQKFKEELLSEAMQFVTTSIHDVVMGLREDNVIRKREDNKKKGLSNKKRDVSGMKKGVSSKKEDSIRGKKELSSKKKDVGSMKEVGKEKDIISKGKDIGSTKKDISSKKKGVSSKKKDVSSIKEVGKEKDVISKGKDIGSTKKDISHKKKDVSSKKDSISSKKKKGLA